MANDALEPLPYKPEHIELIMRALHGVTQEGTSVRSFAGAPYKSGGKTGTAQAVGIKANQKYDASKMEEHKRDHSLYIAVAPMPNPTIALAVVVENAGFGSEAAAPIARRVFDYLLLGQYPSEEDLAATRKGQSGAPIGTPRRAADVPLPGQAAAHGRPGVGRRRAQPHARRCRGAARMAAGRSARAAAMSRGPLQRYPKRSRGCPMSAVLQRPSLWQRLKPVFIGFDLWLALAVACLAALGLVTMYSAGFDHGTRFVDHGRNMLLALGVLFLVAQVPPQRLHEPGRAAVPAGRGAADRHGAAGLRHHQEGRDALAQRRHGDPAQRDHEDRHAADAGLVVPAPRGPVARARLRAWPRLLLLLPVGLIMKQPDLGTSLLVLVGRAVRDLLRRAVVEADRAGAGAGRGRPSRPSCSAPSHLRRRRAAGRCCKDYQQHRVCTLLDPTQGPAGQGLPHHPGHDRHRLGRRSPARASCRARRRTWSSSPSAPPTSSSPPSPRSSAWPACCALLLGFTFLIFRGLLIAAEAPTVFTRLLAGAITLSFFTYAFVNMGMVSGILPVVGVPLPFVSYGGTAMVTLGLGLGILMSIAKSRRLMQS